MHVPHPDARRQRAAKRRSTGDIASTIHSAVYSPARLATSE
jgi:hypothetical protein